MTPAFFEKNATTNYTVAFSPVNFEKNMKIVVKIPPEIQNVTGDIQCIGTDGTDKRNLTCLTTVLERAVRLTDAVAEQELNPDRIEFILTTLQNPATNILTSSFEIYTETYDGYLIDELRQNLTVNFYCIFPC